MFEAELFKVNDALIDKCRELIKEKDSNDTLKPLELNPIEYKKRQALKNAISLEIVEFFETYILQNRLCQDLSTRIESVDHISEDLSININRSEEVIQQIFSDLMSLKADLIDIRDRMLKNLSSERSDFAKYLFQAFEQPANHLEVINLTFELMTQEMDFIPAGVLIIDSLHKTGYLDESQHLLINDLNTKLKQSLLLERPTTHVPPPFHRLQTFGIVPDEGENKPLATIIKELFGIKFESTETIIHAEDSLAKALKAASAESGTSCGLIIYLSPNQDHYYDTSSTTSAEASSAGSGVTEMMIKTTDIIKSGNPPEVKKYDIMTINTDETTDQAYALWTNDYKTFKARRKAIDNNMIKNILRRRPSRTIDMYNYLLEHLFKKIRKGGDMLAFKTSLYMSFNEVISEEDFLKMVVDRVVELLVSKKHNAQSLEDDLIQLIEKSKPDMGIDPYQMPSHCHIIYMTLTNKISSRITKSFLEMSSPSAKEIKAMVSEYIATNDNIYSRTISSYYLYASRRNR